MLGFGRICGLQFHIDGFADPQFADAFNAESGGGAAGRFTGWIEDGGAQAHQDAGLESRHGHQQG